MLSPLIVLLVHIAVGIVIVEAVTFAVANAFRAGPVVSHPIAQGGIITVGAFAGFAIWL